MVPIEQNGSGRRFSMRGLNPLNLLRRNDASQVTTLPESVQPGVDPLVEIDRAHHPKDSIVLHLSKEANDLFTDSDEKRLDTVREAFVNTKRDMVMIIEDDRLIQFDDEKPPYMHITVVSPGINSFTHLRNKQELQSAIEHSFFKKRFLEAGDSNPKKAATFIEQPNSKMRSLLTIPPTSEGDMQITLDIQTIPNFDPEQYIEELKEEGASFAALWTEKPNKKEFTRSDYLERLEDPEIEAVKRVEAIVRHGLGEVLGTEAALVADGSLTEQELPEERINDIDLRIVYVKERMNRNGHSEVTVDRATEWLTRTMKGYSLGAKKIIPELQQLTLERISGFDATTGAPIKTDEIKQEPSFTIRIPGSERNIHLTVSAEPVNSIDEAKSREGRIDRPVVLITNRAGDHKPNFGGLTLDL